MNRPFAVGAKVVAHLDPSWPKEGFPAEVMAIIHDDVPRPYLVKVCTFGHAKNGNGSRVHMCRANASELAPPAPHVIYRQRQCCLVGPHPYICENIEYTRWNERHLYVA